MSKKHVPSTVSARDIQRNYRAVFDQAKKTPVIVLINNKADVVVVHPKVLERLEALEQENTELRQERLAWEWADTTEAIRISQEAEKHNQLLTGKLQDLMKDNGVNALLELAAQAKPGPVDLSTNDDYLYGV